MHTARLLTVSRSIPCTSGGRGFCPTPLDADSLPLDANPLDADLTRCRPPWSCDLWCMLGSHPPPLNRMTHKCKNRTFTFESQVKAHMFSHWSKLSFFCVHPGCDKAFFNESDLTRHAKCHNGKRYQCMDCPYKDTDKRNYDSHRLSHSRIANYKCDDCGKEFVYNTQKKASYQG